MGAALPPPPVPPPFLQGFEQLVGVVRGRVRYPDDFDSWHRDDQDEFKRSRFAIGDTLLDAAGMSSVCWAKHQKCWENGCAHYELLTVMILPRSGPQGTADSRAAV